MASDLGWAVVSTSSNATTHGATRQVFIAKFVNWIVAFPVMTTALGLVWGIPWAAIVYNVALTWIWIISYACAAYTSTSYKWGFYAFGTSATGFLAWSLFFDGFKSATRVGVIREYNIFNPLINIFLSLYPIAVGLSDCGNQIGVTPSFIFFGVLDILLVPAFAFIFLFRSRYLDYGKLNIAFTQYGRVRQGGDSPEKDAPQATPAQLAV